MLPSDRSWSLTANTHDYLYLYGWSKSTGGKYYSFNKNTQELNEVTCWCDAMFYDAVTDRAVSGDGNTVASDHIFRPLTFTYAENGQTYQRSIPGESIVAAKDYAMYQYKCYSSCGEYPDYDYLYAYIVGAYNNNIYIAATFHTYNSGSAEKMREEGQTMHRWYYNETRQYGLYQYNMTSSQITFLQYIARQSGYIYNHYRTGRDNGCQDLTRCDGPMFIYTCSPIYYDAPSNILISTYTTITDTEWTTDEYGRSKLVHRTESTDHTTYKNGNTYVASSYDCGMRPLYGHSPYIATGFNNVIDNSGNMIATSAYKKYSSCESFSTDKKDDCYAHVGNGVMQQIK